VAIIPGIQICIPASSVRAADVLKGMTRLLNQRKCGTICRSVFLVAWKKKRLALRQTRDYQQLIDTVRHEAHGVCEACRTRSGDHMHHLKPVAFYPWLALDRKNVMWVCQVCHEDEDQLARDRALNAKRRRSHTLAARISESRPDLSAGGLTAQLGTQASAESGGAKRPIPSPEAR
jgi:5-methylcytosine-specific restriction endonuclease McrA